jgi:hypothetical protein
MRKPREGSKAVKIIQILLEVLLTFRRNHDFVRDAGCPGARSNKR